MALELEEDFVLEQKVVSIPLIVRGYDLQSFPWEEESQIVSFSNSTFGITLSRKCEIGHLLCLSENESQSIEDGDWFANSVEIWGVVQCCTKISDSGKGEDYSVGISLIGDRAPQSYLEDPQQYYRFAGMSLNGYWKVKETEKIFITRKHPRFLATIDAFVGLLDENLNIGKSEKVKTENISFGGAAVFSELDVEIGDCVKFVAAAYEYTALAIVRYVTKLPNQPQKIHLEFAAGRFPIDRLNLK